MYFSLAAYTLLYYLLLPFIVLRLLWRSRLNPGYRKRLLERFGVFAPRINSGGIHFHLVSVGETLAALPLVEHYLDHHPHISVYITSTTPTGSAEVQKRLGTRVVHQYLPFDLPDCMHRFYKLYQPRISILMETELWPQLMRTASARGCYIVLVNARLSKKSALGYSKVGRLTRYMLTKIDVLGCADEASAVRFKALGAIPNNVAITGNLKFDFTPTQDMFAKAGQLRQKLGETRQIWIAGSTHEGEDEIILDAHRQLQLTYPDAILLIAPRHPERFDSVAKLIQSEGFLMQRLSRGLSGDDFSVLLCDTLGELQMLYGIADAAFVGGSLVNVGGHNPIEPIAMRCPVISGSTYYNFTAVYENLIASKGVVIAKDANAISVQLKQLIGSSEVRNMQITAASTEIEKHQGSLNKTINLIDGLL